jgi:hypothetical protein
MWLTELRRPFGLRDVAVRLTCFAAIWRPCGRSLNASGLVSGDSYELIGNFSRPGGRPHA